MKMLSTLMLILLCSSPAYATTPEDALGLWQTKEKDAVIHFYHCNTSPHHLCGQIVWDKDANQPENGCGIQIAEFSEFSDNQWQNGWVYDPRDDKKYKGLLEVQHQHATLTGFIGLAVFGQTEQLYKINHLPTEPHCSTN